MTVDLGELFTEVVRVCAFGILEIEGLFYLEQVVILDPTMNTSRDMESVNGDEVVFLLRLLHFIPFVIEVYFMFCYCCKVYKMFLVILE